MLGLDDKPVTPLASEQLIGKKVLLVDDNAVNREILRRQLSRWGMHCTAASSGAEAQAICRDTPCQADLIMLDQHMPGMDGLSLAGWMREHPGLTATPILILSSGPLKEDAERARKLQVSGYLTKPVTDIDLLVAIKRSLGICERDSNANQPNARQAEHRGQALHILLVEDNPINQQLAIRLLERWGHKVNLAVNGLEAVNLVCRDTPVDLVLMDMQMPVMDGVDATQQIRRHESEHGRTRLPIIAMTANAMQGDRELCLEAGMDDYLSKPINQAELAAKLRIFSPASSVSPAYVSLDSAFTPPATGNFDYAAAISAMDAEIVEILTPAFLEHYAHEFNSLSQAIKQADAAEAMRRAHGLKGTLAAFGAQPAERLAAEIEALTARGETHALQAMVNQLEAELGKLVAVLNP